MNLLAQVSLKAVPELSAKGVPLLMSIVTPDRLKGDLTLDEVKSIYRLLLATKAMGRPYVLGPGVPAARVKALRTAFNKTAEDKGFLGEAKKQRRDVSLVTGEEIQDIVTKMAAAPKRILAKLDDLTRYKGPMATAKVEMGKHTGKVTATKKGGRRISIIYKGKNVTAKVSGSRIKVTVNGKKAKRKQVKVGMTSAFTCPGQGQEATNVDCKGWSGIRSV